MLERLFSDIDAETKKRILTDEYGMIMTTQLEGRLQTMCNLSENILEEGIERGIKQGIEQGIEQGMILGSFEILAELVDKSILSLEKAEEQLKDKKEEFIRWYQEQR